MPQRVESRRQRIPAWRAMQHNGNPPTTANRRGQGVTSACRRMLARLPRAPISPRAALLSARNGRVFMPWATPTLGLPALTLCAWERIGRRPRCGSSNS
jgi:hypothetical protein